MYNPSQPWRSSLLGAASSTGFLPSDVSGLKLWVDNSNLSTLLNPSGLPVSDGDRVATWLDKSGLGNDLTQSVSTARPTYRATAGGRPSIETFSTGVFEVLTHADSTDFDYTTCGLYVGCMIETPGGLQSPYGKYLPSGNQREIQLTASATPNFIVTTSQDGTSGTLTTATTASNPSTSAVVLSMRWNGTTVTAQMNSDTVATSTPAAIFPGTAAVTLGALDGAVNPYKGYIYGAAWYGAIPSDAQHTQIVNYFRSISGA